MSNRPEDIRNLAFIGAGGSGKTTLLEKLLNMAGATSRAGSIDDGNTVSDWDDDERERKQSLYATPTHFDWEGVRINAIDTPGALDFMAEAQSALAAVETAVVCVNAHDGVSVATRRLFRAARDQGLATVVVITRIDGENIQPEQLVSDIQGAIGERAVPLNLPDQFGAGASTVHDIFAQDLPENLQSAAANYVSQATDRVVEVDESLLETYLETGEISHDEMADAFPRALRQGNIVPVFHVSVDKEVGLKKLMHFFQEDCASAVRRSGEVVRPATNKAGDAVKVPADGPFSAQVWKIQIDPHVGKLAFLRVWSGSLGSKTQFVVGRTGETERIGDFLDIQGKDMKAVAKASAGDIVAVAKVESLHLGDTVTDGAADWTFAPVEVAVPKVTLAIEPKNRNDEAKLGPELAKLAESDPGFVAERETGTGEMVVRGMSTLHLDVVLGRLARKKVETVTHTPRIPYLETVTGTGQAQYRHKKQSGGRGQFAEVHLRVSPRNRGEGFEFQDEIVGGSIPRNFIPAWAVLVIGVCDSRCVCSSSATRRPNSMPAISAA